MGAGGAQLAFMTSHFSPSTNFRKHRITKVDCHIIQRWQSVPRMTLSTRQKTINLRSLLTNDEIHLMPCCYDGLSAKLIQRADFNITFLSGFSTAAAHGLPDTGLLSFSEIERAIAAASSVIDIPLIADGDTGFGNALNVRRTVLSYVRAGASGILLEDQVNPKRYGVCSDSCIHYIYHSIRPCISSASPEVLTFSIFSSLLPQMRPHERQSGS